VDRTFGSHSFALVGVVDPERDRLGQIIEYTYDLANVRLNAHGNGPFCNFQLPNAATVAGVYAVTVRDDLVYVGECQNVSARFGPGGYGHIDPRNCHSDGQSTNCKVNAGVLEAAKFGFPIIVWFLSTDRRFEIESELIRDLRPPWNSQRATGSRRVAAKDAPLTAGSHAAGGFAQALNSVFKRAEGDRRTSVRINAGDLHREVGGYPGPSHKMPVCCRAMRSAMENGDRVIESPPSGNGASLTIEYRLPRTGRSTL
jgi:hypothetical protein